MKKRTIILFVAMVMGLSSLAFATTSSAHATRSVQQPQMTVIGSSVKCTAKVLFAGS